jgi:hypothetical protein
MSDVYALPPPDLVRRFYDPRQFRPLLAFAQEVAFFCAGEPALAG